MSEGPKADGLIARFEWHDCPQCVHRSPDGCAKAEDIIGNLILDQSIWDIKCGLFEQKNINAFEYSPEDSKLMSDFDRKLKKK